MLDILDATEYDMNEERRQNNTALDTTKPLDAFAGVFGLLFLEGMILYNIIFGRAFEIPEKVDELKREIRKMSYKIHRNNPMERKYVEKYLRSIPWLGVKDGVYKMERMTCPNFTSFTVEQITDLVLTY